MTVTADGLRLQMPKLACQGGPATSSEFLLTVIAGGSGRRMGLPKHGLTLHNRPILQDLLSRCPWNGPKVLVLGKNQPLPAGAGLFDLVLHDSIADQGPVQGFLAALLAAQSCEPAPRGVLCIPVDMPGLTAEHLRWLADRFSELPASAGLFLTRQSVIEPFPCVLATNAIAHIREFFTLGGRALHKLAALPAIRTLQAPDDWPEHVWTNLNTPQDLQAFTSATSSAEPHT